MVVMVAYAPSLARQIWSPSPLKQIHHHRELAIILLDSQTTQAYACVEPAVIDGSRFDVDSVCLLSAAADGLLFGSVCIWCRHFTAMSRQTSLIF